MQIIGLGTDIVEISRVQEVLANFPGRFQERVYTPAEVVQGEERRNKVSYFAGRWAAKEACSKALGCGIGEACGFTDIEILNNAKGTPVMQLSGAALGTAKTLGVDRIMLSISHENHYAVETVILCGKDD